MSKNKKTVFIIQSVGLVQLRNYPKQIAEIDKAMNYFWDLLKGVPGIKAHRPPKDSGTTKGGWYGASGLYHPEELGGLSITQFCEAVNAEGSVCSAGCNRALHLHPIFNEIDVYNHGKSTRISNLHSGTDVRQRTGSLPISEDIQKKVFSIPWFKNFRQKVIKERTMAYRKIAERYRDLLTIDIADKEEVAGIWGLTAREKGQRLLMGSVELVLMYLIAIGLTADFKILKQQCFKKPIGIGLIASAIMGILSIVLINILS